MKCQAQPLKNHKLKGFNQPFQNSQVSKHMYHDDSKLAIKLQDADIPPIVKNQLNEMLNTEFTCIISKSSADFGRT